MGFNRGGGGATMADKHYDELYRMVQQLSSDMGRRQQGITIVHGADSKCDLDCGQLPHGSLVPHGHASRVRGSLLQCCPETR